MFIAPTNSAAVRTMPFTLSDFWKDVGPSAEGGDASMSSLSLDRQVVLPGYSEHLDVAARLSDAPIDEFAVVRRPGRLCDCE